MTRFPIQKFTLFQNLKKEVKTLQKLGVVRIYPNFGYTHFKAVLKIIIWCRYDLHVAQIAFSLDKVYNTKVLPCFKIFKILFDISGPKMK